MVNIYFYFTQFKNDRIALDPNNTEAWILIEILGWGGGMGGTPYTDNFGNINIFINIKSHSWGLNGPKDLW